MATTITTKGQVTIPKRVRDALGLTAGSKVEFQMDSAGRVVITRVTGDTPPSRFDRWVGSAGPGLSTDEVMRLTRGED